MRINSRGLELIKHFEGLRLESYQDVKGVWTIGYGHTHYVTQGQKITKLEAEELLKKDIKIFEDYVDAFVKTHININQFSALVSFTYNIGPSNFKRSTLLRKLNEGLHDVAANEFLKWNRSGNKVFPGLTRRREAERALFLTPLDESNIT